MLDRRLNSVKMKKKLLFQKPIIAFQSVVKKVRTLISRFFHVAGSAEKRNEIVTLVMPQQMI